MQKPHRKCEVDVEGVIFSFDWDKFAIGDGVFIPCFNTAATMRAVQNSARKHGIKARTRKGIFRGKYGVALWRIA